MESTEIMNDIAQGLEQLANQIDTINDRLRWQLVIAIIIYMAIQVLFSIAIVNYAAAKNAETFNYEKLAKAIATETVKAQALAAKQQATKEQEALQQSCFCIFSAEYGILHK